MEACTSKISLNLSAFSCSSTFSGKLTAFAGGLSEYLKAKIASNSTSCKREIVSLKSFSVSPGKPTIKSVVIEISGQALRKASIFCKYSLLVYFRPILFKMRSEPDCTGK